MRQIFADAWKPWMKTTLSGPLPCGKYSSLTPESCANAIACPPLARRRRRRGLRPLHGGLDDRDLVVGERLHPALSRRRRFEERGERFRLLRVALGDLGLELGHHLGREKLKRFADVLVFVAAGLLQEDHLVDAGRLERLDVAADVVRRPNAVGVPLGAAGCRDDLLVPVSAGFDEV